MRKENAKRLEEGYLCDFGAWLYNIFVAGYEQGRAGRGHGTVRTNHDHVRRTRRQRGRPGPS